MALLDRRFKAYPQSGHADWKTWFYLVAQLIGSAGLTILLLTMLWPTQKRKYVPLLPHTRDRRAETRS